MPTLNCSQALRAIGEDLEQRGIKAFDITCAEDYYMVQGGYQAPPNPMPLSLSYSLEDIRYLDNEHREKRDQACNGHDFLRLPLILRSIAGYISRKKGRLLRISNNVATGTNAVFRIEYSNADNERVVDERAVSAIYDICVSQYKLRGNDLRTPGSYCFGASGVWQERDR
jgi:hypothetical protein